MPACAGTSIQTHKNKDFVTPAAGGRSPAGARPRTGLSSRAWYDVNNYISTGNNRKIDWNNIAPRIGFSYDLNADQRTVFFGGLRPLLRPRAVPRDG